MTNEIEIEDWKPPIEIHFPVEVKNEHSDAYYIESNNSHDEIPILKFKSEIPQELSTNIEGKSEYVQTNEIKSEISSSDFSVQSLKVEPSNIKKEFCVALHKCNLCEEFFDCISELEFHTKKHSEIRKLVNVKIKAQRHPCNLCEKVLKSSKILKIHIETVHIGQSQRYPCNLCEKVLKSSIILKKHMKNVHKCVENCHMNTYFKCEQCKEKFISSIELKIHEKHCQFCKYCNKEFSDKNELVQHVNTDHICQYCGVYFSEGVQLKIHIDNKHGCHLCEEKFSSIELKKHIMESHKCVPCNRFVKDLKEHNCEICPIYLKL